jgi:ribosomal protein L4
MKIEQDKTKEVVKILSILEPLLPTRKKGQNLLLLLDKIDVSIKRAANNIKFLDINLDKDTNANQVLKARHLIITKAALKNLIERIKSK